MFALFQSAVFGGQKAIPAKSPVEKLNLRIHQQQAQIAREAHLGKLTKDQAKSLKTQLAGVKHQEATFLKGNNGQPLGDSQIAQLNQQLNTLSKAIPIK
jgi:hypothetical protein